ncbi:MAG: fructose bisphosphate aldolase [Proteobacteria bacterium]|nr:fructose bisphosphate aldolase [Pseudomonadota bacterium]
MTVFQEWQNKIKTQTGFVAALDQSGGSTPKALKLYGVNENEYTNETEMYDLMHQMRSRIVTSPSFNGDRILGAILFEQTVDRQIEGIPSARYLWEKKKVVPFLKIDKGLVEEVNGAQCMKPITNLDELLEKARSSAIFGTKMRSVIKLANQTGIKEVVDQQFEIAHKIIAAGLMPIIEPEVDINSPEKSKVESILQDEILKHLNSLKSDQSVMLKLTIPDQANFYRPCIEHGNCLKVLALSGGYARDDANKRLAQNNGMVASFSRAFTEGLLVNQSDEEFNKILDNSIQSIYEASSK